MLNAPCGGSGTGAHWVRADDGIISRATEALSDIPVPSDNFPLLEDRFWDKGLDPSGGGGGRPEWRRCRGQAVAAADQSDGAAPT
jgi:hypothetical protein